MTTVICIAALIARHAHRIFFAPQYVTLSMACVAYLHIP
jgi:hypothetical protein